MLPLVFLHGLGGGKAVWDRQIAHFRTLGHPCFAWDQPGYGQSPPVEPYTFEKLAQEFYARYPEKVAALALCFTSAAFAADTDFARQFVAIRVGPLDAGKSMLEIARQVLPTQRGSVSDEPGFQLAVRIMGEVPPATYRQAVQAITTFDRSADLPKIAVPTLLVAGSDDVTAPAPLMGRMAKQIPGTEFVVLRGCGHLGQMDQPDAFNQVLEGFLRRRL